MPSKADVERWADEAAISQSYAEDSRRVVALYDMLTWAMGKLSEHVDLDAEVRERLAEWRGEVNDAE